MHFSKGKRYQILIDLFFARKHEQVREVTTTLTIVAFSCLPLILLNSEFVSESFFPLTFIALKSKLIGY